MAQPELDQKLQDEFHEEIKVVEERTGLKCIVVDGIDADETPNPTIEDLRNLKKIFVTENGISNIERISKELGMVGCSSENDFFSMTNTRHSVEFYAIFRSESRKCSIKHTKKKYVECMDQLIGIILGLKDFPMGFMDTEDTESGQRILNNILKLWKKAVVTNHGLTEDTISVLYEILQEIGEEFSQFDYDFNPGVYRRRRSAEDEGDDNDDGEDGDDGGDGGGNQSNHNRRRRRRSSEEDDGAEDDENDENPRPRQRRRISR